MKNQHCRALSAPGYRRNITTRVPINLRWRFVLNRPCHTFADCALHRFEHIRMAQNRSQKLAARLKVHLTTRSGVRTNNTAFGVDQERRIRQRFEQWRKFSKAYTSNLVIAGR